MSNWVVPGYTEVRELGRGASGRVVLATHDQTGVPVAIKYLADNLRGDDTFLREFRAEARILAEVENPYVARLYEYVESSGGAAIVMELVDGVSMRAMLRQQGPTEAEAALVVLKGSLLGLAATHGHGVVHRDYKPENVLVDGQGQSKLADFGIAVRAGRQGILAGTPSYMAPEQWAGGTATPQTDIYAATATFYECLVGKPPYTAPGDLASLRRQHEEAPIPVEAAPEALRGLLRRGMAKNPGHRPKDATTFLRELEAVAGGAYGTEWEEEGKKKLARRALLLALLFPLAMSQMGGTAIASTGFGAWSALKKALVAGGTTLVLVGGGVTGCLVLNTPTVPLAAVATPTASASPTPSPSPSQSPSPSPSESPSPSPSKTTRSPRPSLSPKPLPTITTFVFNLDRTEICTQFCDYYLRWNATAGTTGSGKGTLHVRFYASSNTTQRGPQTSTWDLDFTAMDGNSVIWNNTANQTQPRAVACANGTEFGSQWLIAHAWITVGGKTVMSQEKAIGCYDIIT